MIIYSIWDGGFYWENGPVYCRTLSSAYAEGRDAADYLRSKGERNWSATISRHKVAKMRKLDLVLSILNESGWAAESTEIGKVDLP